MITTKHGNLVRNGTEGNGYHGRCEYCGLDYTTDLGFNSWEGTQCIDHHIISEIKVSEKVRNYARFRGMHWRVKTINGEKVGLYVKPYVRDYTLEELYKKVTEL